MTLLIACLLVYHLNMPWWWYVVATIIWLAKMAVLKAAMADLEAHR